MARPYKPKGKGSSKRVSPSAGSKKIPSRSKAVEVNEPAALPLMKGNSGGYSSNRLILLGLWTAFSLVTLTFSNFSWMLPGIAHRVPFQQSLGISFLLFAGLVLACSLARENNFQDLSPWAARFWLLASLGLGSYLCFYRWDIPMANSTIDSFYMIAHIKHIADLNNYQGFLAPGEGLWPFSEFVGILLWHLIPDASAILIERLFNGVLDVAALWVLYLAGKEVGGRRMGILTAALAAVSKPLIVKVVAGFGYSSMTFGMSLALLFTLRLMERKGVWDFLKWGTAVGFLAYTCTPFQPFIPFFIFTVFALLFYKKEKEWPGPLAWISFVVLLTYFLFWNNAFHGTQWWDSILGVLGPNKLWILLAGFLVFASFRAFQEHRKGSGSVWTGWMAGAWVATALSYHVVADESFLTLIQQHSLASGSGFLSWAYLSAAFHRVAITFQSLFWVGGDRADMAPAADAYFSYPEVILIALGLAFGLGRPNRKILYLILAAIAGTAPHFFSSETHSGRLIACPPAFLLVGAYGLHRLLTFLYSTSTKSFIKMIIWILMVGFWAWAAYGVYERVYQQWALKPVLNVAVRNEAIKDVAQGRPVYIAPVYVDGYLGIMYEGYPVHPFQGSNPLFIGSDQAPSDTVVYITADPSQRKALEKAFPKAVWSDVRNADQDPTRSIVAFRCQIPPEEILDPRQNIFVVHPIRAPYWRRMFTGSVTGMTFGILNWDDKTANVHEPTPPQVYLDYAGVRYEGLIHMAKEGEYEFHCKTVNRTVVLVDGKKLFDFSFFRTAANMAPGVDVHKTWVLGEGNHRIQVTTCFQRDFGPPDITIDLKGSAEPERSLWGSFEF